MIFTKNLKKVDLLFSISNVFTEKNLRSNKVCNFGGYNKKGHCKVAFLDDNIFKIAIFN